MSTYQMQSICRGRLDVSVVGKAWCTDQFCQTGEYQSICRKDWRHQWWEMAWCTYQWCTDQLCQTREYQSLCRKDWRHQWWEWHDVQINNVKQVSTRVYAGKIGGISDGEMYDVQINYVRQVKYMQERLQASVMGNGMMYRSIMSGR